jgi:hypothetical protein
MGRLSNRRQTTGAAPPPLLPLPLLLLLLLLLLQILVLDGDIVVARKDAGMPDVMTARSPLALGLPTIIGLALEAWVALCLGVSVFVITAGHADMQVASSWGPSQWLAEAAFRWGVGCAIGLVFTLAAWSARKMWVSVAGQQAHSLFRLVEIVAIIGIGSVATAGSIVFIATKPMF